MSRSLKRDAPIYRSLRLSETPAAGAIVRTDSQAVQESPRFVPRIPTRDLHQTARIAEHIRNKDLAATRIGRRECPRGRTPKQWRIARSRPTECCSTTDPMVSPQALRSGALVPGKVGVTSSDDF